MLETLDYTIRIGSTPTFLYFDLKHLFIYECCDTHCCRQTKMAQVKQRIVSDANGLLK